MTNTNYLNNIANNSKVDLNPTITIYLVPYIIEGYGNKNFAITCYTMGTHALPDIYTSKTKKLRIFN